ncbi:hypothetical protein H8B09_13645 [Paenibacillus sp. PR3]|uniref:Uncharacterized protein n=1 Tax=Paenibacillus terricola TaxID=2763503 RepID=A0ABR8MV16_9BACL|nr:hypothetical protein [Paenibacillus terricola]MBD3919802.1 hypothetical protein [Paenibacillus terricola]
MERSEENQDKQPEREHTAAAEQPDVVDSQESPIEDAPGPVDALPAWRPFYAAVRDSMQRLRGSDGLE